MKKSKGQKSIKKIIELQKIKLLMFSNQQAKKLLKTIIIPLIRLII